MSYKVPETAEARMADLTANITTYQTEYNEFKTKGKKAAGSRAKKALTTVKKLIISVRRDIQAEIDLLKKEKKDEQTA